ncbi:hypothetical protein E2562_028014 [Oryza meyeriana var. granulata]|uniref:Uncharacterized protein n=1 Tax=Oryza meyeriana var. granulata TaxID=110450 RepID=A0A6G1CTY1_9ORYZ|nr:hypothetical protein E2562_028014 [Oryza meyeriana var. granulata]
MTERRARTTRWSERAATELAAPYVAASASDTLVETVVVVFCFLVMGAAGCHAGQGRTAPSYAHACMTRAAVGNFARLTAPATSARSLD